jgi:predicted acylesterase/phospholipase RssA/CRP-like cAMP-binding protein
MERELSFDQTSVLINRLLLLPIFQNMNSEELERFIPYLKEEEHVEGTAILSQGQIGTVFHIVLSGKVGVYVEGESRVQVAELGFGDFFGEMSCLTGDQVSATVQAVNLVETIAVNREGLLQLMDNSSTFRSYMIEAMVKRIQKSNDRVQEEHLRSAVMIKAMHLEGEARYSELQGQSEAIIRVRGQLQDLAKQPIPVAIVGEDGVGKGHAAARLHYGGPRREGPFLMISALDFSWPEWEEKLRAAKGGTLVLKKADQLPTHVLQQVVNSSGDTRVVLSAKGTPELTGVHRLEFPPLRERREDIPTLVRIFLRQAGVVEPDSAISAEAIRRLFIYPFLSANVEELAKVIQEAVVLAKGAKIRPEHLSLGRYRRPGSRPTIGLALGSGAVRGSAHVGVLKVLEQENIPVDMIAGSSIGAVIGALYASGFSVGDIERILPTVRWRNLTRFIWPKEAFTENRPMGRWLQQYIGNITFDDLRIPFAAVASDAGTGEAYVLRSGSVIEAIRASTAIPFMIKPVQIDGRTLMDGGVVHRVPVALARSMGADIVIAVDVSVPSFAAGPARNLIDSLLHTIAIMSEHQANDEMELADVVIRPQVPVSGYSFKNAMAFIQKGEQQAREVLPIIRKKMVEFID